ncbi:hypothetical protein [Janthinobacterium lividum]|uniref:hypothetical protein n=1 Tax=Janthinobacterium lividum TaxID=29581 RepID=UPI001594FB0B|nr:hypothetical protein [Janthinobacterium lividum]QKY11988.1 hypothetical protein G8765_29290 [Janthinobacterium lividum]
MSNNASSLIALHGVLSTTAAAATPSHNTAREPQAGLAERLLAEAASDRHVLAALAAYAVSCEVESPSRADAIRDAVIARILQNNCMVTVPGTVVGGALVPAFRVGAFLCGQGAFDTIQIDPWTAPWTSISFLEAKRISVECGMALLTERQALAIASNIMHQPVNWTGGAVGHGRLYQGLHKGMCDGPQPGMRRSTCLFERRWHVLSNGEVIHDVSGNAYTWIFDDIQGNADGIVAGPFPTHSPTVERAEEWPYPIGAGDGPSAGADYSGEALIRGGHWFSGDVAGIFHLRAHEAERTEPEIGFRVTLPLAT